MSGTFPLTEAPISRGRIASYSAVSADGSMTNIVPLATRAPPPRSPLPWIGVGVLAGVLLACPCGIGIGWLTWRTPANDAAGKGAFTGGRPLAASVLGRWESVKIDDGYDMELRKDGTGTLTGIQREFKWRIEAEKKPVFVLDDGQPIPCHVKIEGDTLTLTPLNSGRPPIILRRIK